MVGNPPGDVKNAGFLQWYPKNIPKNDGESAFLIDKSRQINYGGFQAACSSGWYRSHRENHVFCPRKVEKSKSRKVEKFTSQENSARKVEKIEKSEKFEKSKSRKNRTIRKIRKVEKSIFLFVCENFPERVINPVRFWRHWSTGSIHAQGFLWLFGCSFPVELLVTFQGSRKPAISVSGLDFVLLM